MNKKYPIFYLLEIPVYVFLYAIAVGLGARLDAFIFGIGTEPAQEAQPFPVFTVLIFVLGTLVLLVAVIYSIVQFVRGTIRKNQKKKAAKAALSENGN